MIVNKCQTGFVLELIQNNNFMSMNLNELTYFRANPHYKQDYMPDRAWYNRKKKQFPSQLPSGAQFFTDNGRKHFSNRFNHSQIEEEGVLKSVEKYPYEHRIALDKSYMRSLHTIDIEGASSNTRVNQSIKNKYKARDQLARRYNQSLQPIQKTEEVKRREVAEKHSQFLKQRSISQREQNDRNQLNYSRVDKTNNPELTPSLKKDLSEEYKRYIMHNSSNKYHKNIAQPKFNGQLSRIGYEGNDGVKFKSIEELNDLQRNFKQTKFYQSKQPIHQNQSIDLHQANKKKSQQLKRQQEYQRSQQYNQICKKMMESPTNLRKNNPTNLSSSISMAGRSIVLN